MIRIKNVAWKSLLLYEDKGGFFLKNQKKKKKKKKERKKEKKKRKMSSFNKITYAYRLITQKKFCKVDVFNNNLQYLGAVW